MTLFDALMVAATIFPMPPEAMRRGRVRALAKEAARDRLREIERQDRQAHARRAIVIRSITAGGGNLKPSREERQRRRQATAEAREAETARLALGIAARQAIDRFRYRAETVRLRDEHVFSPDDEICRGMELPPLSPGGFVPGTDATGRVLGITKGRLVYKRRTRLFAEITLREALWLRVIINEYPVEAERLAIVHEARSLFWQCLQEMRERDRQHGLGGGSAPPPACHTPHTERTAP